MKTKHRHPERSEGPLSSTDRACQAPLTIKASGIFILDQGTHRQLLHAKHPDPEVDLRTRAIYLLQRVTAIRISEALALNVEQVWNGHEVLSYIALRAEQTKGKRNGRNLSLLDQYKQAQRALRDYIRFREKSEGRLDPKSPLFVSAKSATRLDRVSAHRAFRRWALAAMLPVGKTGGLTTHTPRHTKLSEAVNRGDLPLALAIAGHADSKTLIKNYLHVDLARMHDHNSNIKL